MLKSLMRMIALAAGLFLAAGAFADDEPSLDGLIRELAVGGYSDKRDAVDALAAPGDPRAARVLQAMSAGNLYVRDSDGAVFIGEESGGVIVLKDPLSEEKVGEAAADEVSQIRVNNSVRRTIRDAVARLTLLSSDPRVRAEAAEAAFRLRDAEAREALAEAYANETDPKARRAQSEALAALTLADPEAEEAAIIEAAAMLKTRSDAAGLRALTDIPEPSTEAARLAVAEAARSVENNIAVWSVGQNFWFGLSYASVLFLAAIGLAITFGVMGVINMAHGEMVMLGAYTTFTVQTLVHAHAPALADWSLLFALPLAFAVSGLVGIGVERSVVRWLYKRPLETLLATWGVSLILQQAVRSIFGASNLQVSNPSWMSGAFQLGHLSITYNRFWIFLFAFAVAAAILFILKWTAFGAQIRAVTQNRAMAASMGVNTDRVDALTFGLGSGIAGVAGVALSQIGNVSPNLGQIYIIDSFMVVVLGGVGSVWGTMAGGGVLGVAQKGLEPVAGAVLAKVVMLVLVIIFIQIRPRGLFALRGRAVE